MTRLYIPSVLIILFGGIVLFCGTSCTKRKIQEFNAELIYYNQAEICNEALWYPDRKSLFWIENHQNKLVEYILSKDTCNSWLFNCEIGYMAPETKNTVILALGNKIVHYNLNDQTEKIIALIDDEYGKICCNNGKCSPNGKLWVVTENRESDKGISTVYRVDPDGKISKMFKGMTVANGLAWSNNKQFMYHNDVSSGLVKRYRYDIKTEDVIHNGAAVMIPKETGIPEGITIDKHDNLWIPQRGGFGVYCYNPYTSQLIAKVNIPVPHATSCTFGGENLDTLFITTSRNGLTEQDLIEYPLSGSIFACKIAPIGVKAFYFGRKNY